MKEKKSSKHSKSEHKHKKKHHSEKHHSKSKKHSKEKKHKHHDEHHQVHVTISGDDYFTKSEEFRVWLKLDRRRYTMNNVECLVICVLLL